MAEASYVSAGTENPYNITATQAREIGSLIGCDLFVLIKSAVQRRSSFSKPEFYEAFAAIYLVSSRTGRLASWQLESYEAAKPVFAEDMLLKSVPAVAGKLRITASRFMADEVARYEPDRFDPLPDEGSPNAKGLRPPMPYKRIKPEYTPTAFLYDVRATVEIEVSIDAAGKVVSTDIVRWAGYGLDESVTRAILNMNWRPAERNGKQLPMRVLLRYNFTKIEKEDL
jgi:TonB family protein